MEQRYTSPGDYSAFSRPVKSRITTNMSSKKLTGELKSALSVQPYKLKHRVDTARVSKIAGESMSCRLDGVVYDAKICKNLCKDISQAITNQVKKFCPCRYKMVTTVNIGELSSQATLSFASRCIWDESVDTFCTSNYHNSSLYAVVTVYFIYKE